MLHIFILIFHLVKMISIFLLQICAIAFRQKALQPISRNSVGVIPVHFLKILLK